MQRYMAGDYDNASKDRSLAFTGRRDILSSLSSSESSNFSLNDQQEALIEVLLRLPTTKSAFQCKCVCKNWYSLVSTPYFAHRFITRHFNDHCRQNPSALIIGYFCKPHEERLFVVSDEPMFESCGFQLNYIPNAKEVEVLAIFKDLILCSVDRRKGILQCWICNPFTMQCVALPLLEHETGVLRSRVGFVCEPYYFEDSQGNCTINCDYRFRVVHVAKLRNSIANSLFIMWTYCSEIRKWNRSVFKGNQYTWFPTDAVAYDGNLLWYDDRSIFAYDPFNPQLSTVIDFSFIDSPEFPYFCSNCCVGVSQGFLRVMQLVGYGTCKRLAVWEVKDYDTMEWSLEAKVYLGKGLTIIESSLVQEIVSDSERILMPLGFHFSDGDVVYLHSTDFVISCNTMTRELKMVGEVPCQGLIYRDGDVFNLELPLWPTPIHKPIKIHP